MTGTENRWPVLAVLVALGVLWLLFLAGQLVLLTRGGDFGLRAEAGAIVTILAVVTWGALGLATRRSDPNARGPMVVARRLRSGLAAVVMIALAATSAGYLAKPDGIWQSDVEQVQQVAAGFLIERQIRNGLAAVGTERAKLYLGRDLSDEVLGYLRDSFPGTEIIRLEDVPPEQIQPGNVLPMGWNPVEIDRVIQVAEAEFPLWRVATLHFSQSACRGSMILVKVRETWRVVGANLSVCI